MKRIFLNVFLVLAMTLSFSAAALAGEAVPGAGAPLLQRRRLLRVADQPRGRVGQPHGDLGQAPDIQGEFALPMSPARPTNTT